MFLETKQTVQILEISDVNNSVTFGLIASEPPVGYTSATHSIRLYKVTTTNQTFIAFNSDFSNDANVQIIQDSKWKKREFFKDLTKFVCKPVKKAQK